MTRSLAIGAALWLAACAPKIPPGPAAVEVASRPVRIVEQADASSPNVYFLATIHAGSAFDPIGQEGLASLTAHALIDAGAGDRTSTQVREALYPTGNRLQLVVDREWVSVRLRCHKDHAALCLELFTDAVIHPAFDPGDTTRLRDEAAYAVGDGILGDEEGLGEEVFEAGLYEAHPYGHPVAGRGGAIEVLDADDARAFHQRHYVREAMVAGMAGAYDDGLLAAFRQELEAIPAVRGPELVLQRPLPVSGRSVHIVDTETPVTGFHFGHPIAVDRNHPDWPALTVAMTAMGAHRQSFGRLFRILRTARGLNYGDYAYVEPYVQRGWSSLPENGVLRRQNHFYVWLRPTGVENGPFALRLAIAEVERLVADGLTADELDATRAYLQGWVPLLAQDPGRRLAFAVEAEAAGVPDLVAWLPGALDGLTLEQVNAALQAHIHPENLRIVAVSGDGEGLRTRLLEDAPTPIVYRDVTPDEAQASRDAEVAAWPLALEADDVWVAPAQGIFR